MSLRRPLASALLFTSLSLGCQGAESTASEKKAEGAPAAQPAEPDKATVEPAKAEDKSEDKIEPAETETGEDAEPAAPLPDTFEKVGVDVCDQYVTDYGKCIDAKVPEAERDAARRIVFENITAWKQTAAGGPSGQKSLQTACRIAREQAKRATASFGCEW